VEVGYSCTSSGVCGVSTCEHADDGCGGGQLSAFYMLGKVLCVPGRFYPSANVKNCDMPKTWKELRLEGKGSHTTGGLGEFMIPYQWEVWLCHTRVVCGGVQQLDEVCFTYSEEFRVFVPWGLKSELDF